MKRFLPLVMSVVLAGVIPGPVQAQEENSQNRLKEVADSKLQWTGVAVSREGRIFVNFPLWKPAVPFAVGELNQVTGEVTPYPNMEMNREDSGLEPAKRFVCVQSVFVDDQDFLWVLDPANPEFQGVVPGAAKLLKIDLKTNEVVQWISYGEKVIFPESYLNDVRIDTVNGFAYLTDSGRGGIVVTDLKTGESRRLLDGHTSTQSEGLEVVIDGKPWMMNGQKPDVHSDGIALTPSRHYLYYHALTGSSLYRISTSALRDPSLTLEEAAAKVEFVSKTGPVDGMEFDADGTLYLTDLENGAVSKLEGEETVPVISDARLSWPDSLAITPDGTLYVTASQIQKGIDPGGRYQLLKIKLK